MLTEVKAYKSLTPALILHLSETDSGSAETDLIQVRNIEGLDPVKASVSTSPYGSVDGVSHTGSHVESRNIVLTLGSNPDWDIWTYESLRRHLYTYFMPKRSVKLEFYSDDMIPVEISGIVEDVSINIFSREPECLVSIVCPDPYFNAIDPVVITGQSGDPATITYNGNSETGMVVKVTATDDTPPTTIDIQIGDLATYLGVVATVDSDKYFEINSRSLQKYIRNIDIDTSDITNLLGKIYIQTGIPWPTFFEGENEFLVITDEGVHDWELTYIERFGGL